jgi:hypothetical protein
MRRTYQLLLRLYPWDYRAAFAAEMLNTFDSVAQRRRSGKELAALLVGTAREWFVKLTTDPMVRGRALPDVRMMRPPGIAREIWFRASK